MRILVYFLILFAALPAAAQSAAIGRLFNEAAALARAGRFETASERYRSILDRAGSEPLSLSQRSRVHYNLGVCEYQLGRNERATAELETAISLRNGAYPEALYALGMAETALANWPRARSAFERALSLDDRNAEAWFDLAFVHVAENDFDSAEAAFRKAIANGSIDSPFGHNNIGVIRAMRGDFEEARREFEAAYRTSGGRLKMALSNLKLCESSSSLGETGLLAWSHNPRFNSQTDKTL